MVIIRVQMVTVRAVPLSAKCGFSFNYFLRWNLVVLSLLDSNSWAQDLLASASSVPGESLGFDYKEVILIILFNFR